MYVIFNRKPGEYIASMHNKTKNSEAILSTNKIYELIDMENEAKNSENKKKSYFGGGGDPPPFLSPPPPPHTHPHTPQTPLPLPPQLSPAGVCCGTSFLPGTMPDISRVWLCGSNPRAPAWIPYCGPGAPTKNVR